MHPSTTLSKWACSLFRATPLLSSYVVQAVLEGGL